MVESVISFFEGFGITPVMIVFFISLLPILELRGGLIAASLLGIPLTTALPVCIIANFIPVPFIIFFIRAVLRFLQKHGPIKKFANWIENKGLKKGAELEEKYPKYITLGLFLFVAIPLPGTGAWTGSLIASLMGIQAKRAIPTIMVGVLTASVIMSILAYFLPSLMGFNVAI